MVKFNNMPFIAQGKTNWKFLLIVVALAAVVGGGIFWFLEQQIPSYQIVEIEISKKKSNEECEKYTETDCPEGCIVCPPCETCSSFGCYSAEHCKSMGFDESWYEMIKLQRETADWQTYRNEEYGFEVKYPSDFSIAKDNKSAQDNETDYIKIYIPASSGMNPYTTFSFDGFAITELKKLGEIETQSIKTSDDFKSAIKEDIRWKSEGYSNEVIESVTIGDNIQGFKVRINTNKYDEYWYYVMKENSSVIRIVITEGTRYADINISDQILSTFGFIGEDETAKCEYDEMIFYYREGCGWCGKVKSDGSIEKLEDLGVKITQIDVSVGPVEHQFSGVPTFVINNEIYVGYRTFEQLKELLGC